MDCDNKATNPVTTTEKEVPKHKDMENCELSFVKEWQTDSYIANIQEVISAHETIVYINKMTQALESEYQDGSKPSGGQGENIENRPVSGVLSREKLEWETLHEVASMIMQEYTTKIDHLVNKLNEVNRRIMLWQESAFIMDSHRGIDQVSSAQEWIILKENYMDYKRNVLNNSINEIKNTVARLPNN